MTLRSQKLSHAVYGPLLRRASLPGRLGPKAQKQGLKCFWKPRPKKTLSTKLSLGHFLAEVLRAIYSAVAHLQLLPPGKKGTWKEKAGVSKSERLVVGRAVAKRLIVSGQRQRQRHGRLAWLQGLFGKPWSPGDRRPGLCSSPGRIPTSGPSSMRQSGPES